MVKCDNDYSVQNDESLRVRSLYKLDKSQKDDGRRWRESGQQWRAMEDYSTDERLQQETLCRRHVFSYGSGTVALTASQWRHTHSAG